MVRIHTTIRVWGRCKCAGSGPGQAVWPVGRRIVSGFSGNLPGKRHADRKTRAAEEIASRNPGDYASTPGCRAGCCGRGPGLHGACSLCYGWLAILARARGRNHTIRGFRGVACRVSGSLEYPKKSCVEKHCIITSLICSSKGFRLTFCGILALHPQCVWLPLSDLWRRSRGTSYRSADGSSRKNLPVR